MTIGTYQNIYPKIRVPTEQTISLNSKVGSLFFDECKETGGYFIGSKNLEAEATILI